MEEHRTVVYRFLLASVGPSDADDVFQETFLAALRAFPRLRDAANLRGWVLAIATRKAIDSGRAKGRRAVPVADPAEVSAGGGAAVGAASGPPPGADGALPFDPKDPLWLALRALPARQRAAVVHRFVLDRSCGEVAAALGCSEEAARANVSEAVRKLRERVSHADALR